MNGSIRPMMLLAAAICGLSLAAAPKSEAQTLVYRFSFKAEHGINFEVFDAAYFVVEGLGGGGTFVFTYRENGRDYYISAANSGTLFFCVAPGRNTGVVRASADAGGMQSHYLAMGELDGRISANLRGQKVSLGVAKSLNGWVLASDPEDEIVWNPMTRDLGMAGFASMRGRLEDRLTRDANRANLDVASAVESLIAGLERQGYENGAAPDEEETEEEAP
jgi:hypothetical protein